ncbi:MAG: hypothetical protein ACD_84C00042G0008 [uncultured bacterium]|nr:MAG: hypothetical protein ACD_84C00042G0008 [uncultured bacterium]
MLAAHQSRIGVPVSASVRQAFSIAKSGANNPRAKLTLEQINSIRDDDRVQEITAKEHGVSQQHISNIKNGSKW